jgi:hypothetical protein
MSNNAKSGGSSSSLSKSQAGSISFLSRQQTNRKQSEKSMHLSPNINIGGSGGVGTGGGGNSGDLKLMPFPEPTTPIDKLNTPRTVTLSASSAFFPPSPSQIVENDISMTGS